MLLNKWKNKTRTIDPDFYKLTDISNMDLAWKKGGFFTLKVFRIKPNKILSITKKLSRHFWNN